MNTLNAGGMKPGKNPVRELCRLWREYSDAQTGALNALVESLMEPLEESLENPLRGEEVQRKLKNWQNAVWGGEQSKIFREEAQALFILDPQPVVARILFIEQVTVVFDELEGIKLSEDITEAQCWLLRFTHRGEGGGDFVVTEQRTRIVKQEIVRDPIHRLPFNLMRYVYHCWNDFTDQEKQRSIEVLAGWIKAKATFKGLPRAAEVSIDDELPGSAMIALHDLATPALKTFQVTSEAEAARVRGLLSMTEMPRLREWCEKLAIDAAKHLVREYRRNGKDANFDISEIETIPDPIDNIDNFHAREDARSEIKRLLPYMTEREQEACGLRAIGMTYKEGAKAMGIAVETFNEFLDRGRKRVTGELPPCQAYRRANRASAP